MKALTLATILILVGTIYAGEEKKDDPVKAQIAAAATLMKSKQYDGAKTILENLAKDNGDNLDVLLPLAECYDNLKDQGKATETYQKALGIALEKDGGAYKDSKDGKVVVEKCKKALERLDEATAMLRKYADMMEKEATAKFKGKNDGAYSKIMDVVKEWKSNKQEDKETERAKTVKRLMSSKWIHCKQWTYQFTDKMTFVVLVKPQRPGKYDVSEDGKTVTLTWLDGHAPEYITFADDNTATMSGGIFERVDKKGKD